MKMVILCVDFMRAVETVFWRFSSRQLFQNSWNILRKIIAIESNLNNVAPATLLKPLSVMGNFLEVFQEFTKNSFQHKKHLLGVVYQAYK